VSSELGEATEIIDTFLEISDIFKNKVWKKDLISFCKSIFHFKGRELQKPTIHKDIIFRIWFEVFYQINLNVNITQITNKSFCLGE